MSDPEPGISAVETGKARNPGSIIALDRLNLHRGGRAVLHDLSWQLHSGERWLVVGASGAGKTQLLKILAGDVWPDESPQPVRRYNLAGTWHDEPLEVRDEFAWVGPERQDRYERYGWNHTVLQVVGTGVHRTDIPLEKLSASDLARCMTLLRRAGIARLASRRFLTLSYGERRLVLLARALAWRASWLLLDEVATGLDAGNRERMFRLLATRSTSWVCTAHRIDDMPRGANRLLWLVAGSVRYNGGPNAQVLRQAFRTSSVRGGRSVATSAAPPRQSRTRSGESPLEIRLHNASVWADEKRLLTGMDLTIRRGQCWVVHGANGSGKSTLLRTLYGDHAVASDGVIRRAGIVPGVPLDRFRARTGLIAPHLQTDYPRQCSVLDTVVSGLHSSIGLNCRAAAGEQRRARLALREFGMEEHEARPLADMSYGQVRRVLFARATVLRPKRLLLDEPFTGLNAVLRAELLAWLERQIRRGVTAVLATHYRSEWPRNASHELMLSRGRVQYAGTIRR